MRNDSVHDIKCYIFHSHWRNYAGANAQKSFSALSLLFINGFECCFRYQLYIQGAKPPAHVQSGRGKAPPAHVLVNNIHLYIVFFHLVCCHRLSPSWVSSVPSCVARDYF